MSTRAKLGAGLISAGQLWFGLVVGAEPPQVSTDWIDFGVLDAGGVLLQTGKLARGGVSIDVAISVNAPPEAIFEILKACEIAPEYVPNVVDCKLIDSISNGGSELFIQTVKPAFFIPAFEHVFRLDYFPYTRIDVHRVSGPIELMEGTWSLLPRENGAILLMHSMDLRPGFPIPRLFVRATLRRDLPKVLRAVRERAEKLAGN